MAIDHPSDIPSFVAFYEPHTEAYEDAAGTTEAELNDPVGNLPDTEGVEDALTQNTTALKPTLVEGQNGWRVIEGDGVDDIMEQATLDLGAQPFTVVIVVDVLNLSTSHDLWGAGSAGSQVELTVRDTRDYQLFLGTNFRAGSPVTGFQSLHAEGDSTDAIWRDNSLLGSGNAGSNAWPGGFRIHEEAAVRVYSVIPFDDALTSTERSDLDTWIDDRYNNPPPDEAVSVSGALTLSQMHASGALAREAAVSSALTLSQMQLTGQVDREAALSAALTLSSMTVSGTLDVEGNPSLSGHLTLGQVEADGTLDREADLGASLSLGSLQATGTLSREAAIQATLALGQLAADGEIERIAALQGALTLSSLMVSGAVGEQPQIATIDVELRDALSLYVDVQDALTISAELTD